MRNCLKTSEANSMVSLLATSSSYVKSPRSLTMNLEPFEFTKSLLGMIVFMWLDYRLPFTVMLLKGKKLLSSLCFKLLLDLILELW